MGTKINKHRRQRHLDARKEVQFAEADLDAIERVSREKFGLNASEFIRECTLHTMRHVVATTVNHAAKKHFQEGKVI
jgi:hypothetical protein